MVAAKHINLDRLLEKAELPDKRMTNPFHIHNDQPLTLAYALDDAFHFYYEDNLDFLRELNVQLVPFSPLKDKALLAADAYYFGGGFPEVYAQELMANADFRVSVKKAHEQVRPIYAECGGLMYLGELLEVEGQVYEMVGIFKGKSLITPIEDRKSVV